MLLCESGWLGGWVSGVCCGGMQCRGTVCWAGCEVLCAVIACLRGACCTPMKALTCPCSKSKIGSHPSTCSLDAPFGSPQMRATPMNAMDKSHTAQPASAKRAHPGWAPTGSPEESPQEPAAARPCTPTAKEVNQMPLKDAVSIPH
jgi:hypothetical protein